MKKKIKIKIKDLEKNEFSLEENGEKGDYFSFNDLEKLNIEDIKIQLKQKLDDAVKQEVEKSLQKEEENWKNKFKSGDEYKKLENIKNEYESKERELKLKLENEWNNEKREYEKKITKIEVENSHLVEKYSVEKEKLKLELEKESIKKLADEKNIYDKNIKDLNDKLNRKANMNSKLMGEDLEKWIQNEYDESFGMNSNVKLEKTTKSESKKIPDFEFMILDDEGIKISSITIEAKTEAITGGNHKNKEYYPKLDKDRKKLDSNYSLLITELEPDRNFVIKKINDYTNMFVIRPQYFVSFLNLIKYLEEERKYINKSTINFMNKQEILKEFDVIKNEILDNSLKNIEKNIVEIYSFSNKIIENATKIKEKNGVLNTHLQTIKNKINDFKINKIVSQIENTK